MNRVLNSIGKAVEGIAAQMGLDFGAQPPPAPAETKGKSHWVQLGAHAVPYTLKRGKRRTIGFTVGLDGLSVSAPRWTLIIEIEAALKGVGDRRLSVQGYQGSRWIVEDYGDIMVHVFDQESREYYSLDDLWADGLKVDWTR